MAGRAQSFKAVAKGTVAWQGVYRRSLTTIGVTLGAMVTVHGLLPETPWADFWTLLTPLVAFGLGIQIVSGLLSQAPEDK